MDYERALLDLQRDLTLACSAGLVWKDAHPSSPTDRRINEHRNPFCMAVKADPRRLRRCLHSDNIGPDRESGMRCRTCPFGVVEVAVTCPGPLRTLGLAWVGPWRHPHRRPPSGLEAAWLSLPVYPGRSTAMAVARLAHGRLAALLAARRPTAERRAEQSGDALMLAAAAWITANARADLRGGAAARHAGLSLSRFHHRFRTATGTTFAAHRDAGLIAMAQRGLAAGRSATGVASDLGFRNHSRFSELFRRHCGLPPSLWRRRHRAHSA